MKKILYVATVDIHIKSFHLPYLKMLKENGYEVHVATNGEEQFPYCDVKHQICIERSPIKINNLKAIKQLKKIIDEEKFDIIHCHTPMGSVVTRLAAKEARKNGTRVIYTAHGFHFYKGAPIKNWLLFYPVEWYLAKYTDTLITINHEDEKLAKKKFSKRCKDIQYVPGVGIDTDKFNINMSEEEKINLRESLGLKKDDFVLTCVARLDKNKNQGFLIKCMNDLVKEHQKIHLLLAGRDELNGQYQKIVSDLKLEKNIHFLGNRIDVPELLHITDVVVSASKREGLPVNVIEAFACEIPVVALECRGMKDLIEDEKNGYIVNNSERFIDLINKIYGDSSFNQNLKGNTLNTINYYYIENTVERIKQMYFKKKKILHVLASNKYSGAENVACTIIDNLKNNYDIYYCSPQGPIEEHLMKRSIKYIPLIKISYFELKRVIKEIKPDIIHAHDNKASVFSALVTSKIKIISHIHGNNKIMNTNNIKTFLFNVCSRKFTNMIWVSDSSFNDYYFKRNVAKKSIVLYNVIDGNVIEKKSNEFNCEKKYDLIFLGRLAYPKNPERLIEIVKRIREKNANIQVAIVGDGIERERVEKLIKEYNLCSNIEMYGFQNNPYPILKNSKILIMTSIYEGTPMCALEAQCLSIPIIATPVDGLKEIVINDYNGYLLDDNNEFVEKISELLSNEKKMKCFSLNSRKVFIEKNDIRQYLEYIIKFYN